jgi:ketosteroid isomerase-like protein
MQAEALLRCVYARDRDTMYANMHPEFVCHTPGRSQIAGDFVGAAGMQAHVQQMQALTGQTFRPKHQDVFMTSGDWGSVPVQLYAEREGRVLQQRAFGIWRFQDGLLIEHWEMPVDMPAFDAFWA